MAYPKTHLRAALLLAGLLVILIVTIPAQPEATQPAEPISLAVVAETAPPPFEPPVVAAPQQPLIVASSHWEAIEVKSGDNLARIFQRMSLPAADLKRIVDLGDEAASLRNLRPGQKLEFNLSAAGELQAIRYQKNAFDTLVVEREDKQFNAHWQHAAPETFIAFESATISAEHPSLYHAGKAAGLSDNIIMKLSYIFQWDISFALDLRRGDSFSLMYEEIYVDGEKAKEGDIIAATFTNMGNQYQAIRYTNLQGESNFYSPSGDSMRKAFLRDPVHFSHVSSSFNLRRLHPIHKKVMPHRGIDYAARKGTPVVASGDGKVTTRRQNDASGKYVVIQHGQQYTTKYLHLSAFANGIKPGATVKQGDTIGYVGATGWATAPHLHYEFLVNDVHRNPKTVKLPKASPVSADEMARFKSTISPILAQLELSGKRLAAADERPPKDEG